MVAESVSLKEEVQKYRDKEAKEKLIKECDDRFKRSFEMMKNKHHEAAIDLRRYRNISAPLKESSSKVRMILDLYLSTIQGMMPTVNDWYPDFNIKGDYRKDEFFADRTEKRKNKICRDAFFKYKGVKAVEDSFIVGNGIEHIKPRFKPYKVIVDGDGVEEGADGHQSESAREVDKKTFSGIDISNVDYFTWFPAPGTYGMSIAKGETDFQCFAVPKSLEYIKRKYKHVKGIKEVKAEGYIDNDSWFHIIEADSKKSKHNADHSLVKEVYFMDKDDENYPLGRRVIWVGNLLLDDKVMTGRIPYFIQGNYRTAHSILGISETFLIKSIVKAINQIMSALAESIKKTSNPIRTVLSSWLNLAKEKIRGIAGEDVEVETHDDIKWVVPPSVPAYVIKYIDILLSMLEKITGLHEVAEGSKPKGDISGKLAGLLSEATKQRLRFKLDHEIGKIVVEKGRFIVDLIQQYDEEAAEFNVSIGYKNKPKYVTYDPNSNYLEERQKADRVMADKYPEMTSKQAEFSIEIVPGPRLPVGRAATEARARELVTEGLYTPQRAIMSLADTDKADLIEEYEESTGLKQMMDKQQAMNDILPEFEKLVDSALEKPEEWEGSRDEKNLSKIVYQYPDFLLSDEYKALPTPFKKRVELQFHEGEAA